MLCKSPPSHGSGEAHDRGEDENAVADEADIYTLRQKNRNSPWEVRAEAELNNRIGCDDDYEDQPNRGEIPFRDIGD